jgi:hypothetical protein
VCLKSKLAMLCVDFAPLLVAVRAVLILVVHQRGANKGPISAAAGFLPLVNVLMGIAKLFRLRQF